MNRPFVRLCPCGCRMYGVWKTKWAEDWAPRDEGDFPREGLLGFRVFHREAMDRAFQEASAEGARRLKAALEAHAPQHAATVPSSTWRKLGI
jgi:hypothetical protein